VRADGDLGRAAQARLLGAALVEAHVVEQVAQRGEFLIDAAGLARMHAQSVDPAEHARIEFVVHAHRIIDAGRFSMRPGSISSMSAIGNASSAS
jgi:hypothetical protein